MISWNRSAYIYIYIDTYLSPRRVFCVPLLASFSLDLCLFPRTTLIRCVGQFSSTQPQLLRNWPPILTQLSSSNATIQFSCNYPVLVRLFGFHGTQFNRSESALASLFNKQFAHTHKWRIWHITNTTTNNLASQPLLMVSSLPRRRHYAHYSKLAS